MTRLALALLLGAVACGGGQRGPVAEAPPRGETAAAPEAAPPAGPASADPPTAPDAPPSPPGPPPPDPALIAKATLAKLEWPATTRSFALRRDAHAYAAPDLASDVLGKIVAGTRLPIGEAVDGDKRCEVWLAAAPRGWVCARHATSSTKEPLATTLPVVPAGHLLPQDYYSIAKGAARYANEEAVRAGTPLPDPKHKSSYMVTQDEAPALDVGGTEYVKTSVGWVASTDVTKFRPSTFAGIDLVATPPPSWPFAWVSAANRKKVVARTDAAKKAPKGASFEHRAIVPVLEERDGFVRVGDGQWIDRASLRVARTRPRPAIADAHAKWIDLDRDEQVMIAYDGDTPVFATLFSSGRRKNDTPPAIYRIRSKSALTKMSAEEQESSFYEVSEVPWATRFRSGLYFHAAYWHDRFGQVNSHGCVNLSAIDAKWVYDWTEPTIPAGWSELEVPVDGSMVVRVYDAKHVDPPVFDYDKEREERVKIRKREERLKQRRLAAEAAAAAAAAQSPPAPAAPP